MVIATHAEKTRTTTLDVATVGPRARSSAKSALRGMDYASGAAALSTRGKGTSRKNGPGECDGYLPTMMALHTELANAYPALPDAAYDWVDSVICDTDPTPQTAHFEDRHDRDYALWWNGSQLQVTPYLRDNPTQYPDCGDRDLFDPSQIDMVTYEVAQITNQRIHVLVEGFGYAPRDARDAAEQHDTNIGLRMFCTYANPARGWYTEHAGGVPNYLPTNTPESHLDPQPGTGNDGLDPASVFSPGFFSDPDHSHDVEAAIASAEATFPMVPRGERCDQEQVSRSAAPVPRTLTLQVW